MDNLCYVNGHRGTPFHVREGVKWIPKNSCWPQQSYLPRTRLCVQLGRAIIWAGVTSCGHRVGFRRGGENELDGYETISVNLSFGRPNYVFRWPVITFPHGQGAAEKYRKRVTLWPLCRPTGRMPMLPVDELFHLVFFLIRSRDGTLKGGRLVFDNEDDFYRYRATVFFGRISISDCVAVGTEKGRRQGEESARWKYWYRFKLFFGNRQKHVLPKFES